MLTSGSSSLALFCSHERYLAISPRLTLLPLISSRGDKLKKKVDSCVVVVESQRNPRRKEAPQAGRTPHGLAAAEGRFFFSGRGDENKGAPDLRAGGDGETETPGEIHNHPRPFFFLIRPGPLCLRRLPCLVSITATRHYHAVYC